MSTIPSPTTPQPYRSGNARDAYELELWDDHVAAVFADTAASLVIPMRVAGRLAIMAQGLLAAAGSLTVSVNAVPLAPVGVTSGAESAHVITFVDVPAGTHTITILATAGLSDYSIVVRRGRIP